MDEFTMISPRPAILTSRLLLRPLEERDITSVYVHWLNDLKVTQTLEVRHAAQTHESVVSYVLQRNRNSESGRHFGIFDRDGERHVGTVTLNGFNSTYMTADISFVIGHPEAQGLGYATEAVSSVCFYAFEAMKLHKLTGGHYVSNTGSFRVFQKNGFKLEGLRREQVVNIAGEREDVLLHGLLAREFCEQNHHSSMIPKIFP